MKVVFASLAALLWMLPQGASAGTRFALEPSLQIVEVQDDNLNFSSTAPVQDRIRRISPALELRLEGRKWTTKANYGMDSETFAAQSNLDNPRARQRGSFTTQYTSPRVTFAIDAGYLDTTTIAELNADTGLAAARIRGRQFSGGPMVRYRLSPRTSISASASSITTDVEDGTDMRAQIGTISIERRMTPRAVFAINYERDHHRFSGADVVTPTIETHAAFATWTRDFGLHSQWMLRAGSRITNGSAAGDFAGIVTHNWRTTSIALSAARTQTTVIGFADLVDTDSVQARLAWFPNRRISLFVAPAVIRSRHENLQGTVQRVSISARYMVSSLVGFDVAYNHDDQDGAIDPLQANAEFSHATLSIGLTTRLARARK